MIREFKGKKPVIAREAIVDSTAIIMGNVFVESGVTIWPHAVIRADEEEIIIRRDAAILEKAFIEAPKKVIIGEGSIISHGAIVHGSIIGENVLVGIGAIVLEVNVGKNSIIAAGSVITKDVEEGSMVAGVPARKIREVNEKDIEKTKAMLEELKAKAVYLR
ncbi:MAG: gamma carbonic anhydrase family protein [Thermoplasmata archaeon]|nr:MAG: gamma carbonic anhydrase family protein [Thermoplasmata archaeon]